MLSPLMFRYNYRRARCDRQAREQYLYIHRVYRGIAPAHPPAQVAGGRSGIPAKMSVATIAHQLESLLDKPQLLSKL
jgi:hypothetical protein